jgi:hypothetical protein
MLVSLGALLVFVAAAAAVVIGRYPDRPRQAAA